MAINISGISTGMTVYGSDNQEIGSVSNVWPDVSPVQTHEDSRLFGHVDDVAVVPTADQEPFSSDVTEGLKPIAGPLTLKEGYGNPQPVPDAATGYFEVDQGGILGIGSSHLYIPMQAVESMFQGDRLTLSYAKDEAIERFSTKPAFLDVNR